MEDTIRKYALQNAIKFNGKANPGAVIGRLISEKPELKAQLKDLQATIQQIIHEVNQLSVEEQTVQLQKFAPELLKEETKERKKEFKELEGVKKGVKIVMRFAPSPSGPLHIGHAYVLGLNYAYTQKYHGEFILRIEDTNPANISPDAYDLIPQDAQWLTHNNVKKILIQSERMELYYTYAVRLLEEGHAYVCTCPAEEFRELAKSKVVCPCRKNHQRENLQRWKKMGTSFKEGEAVVRFKTDIIHKNPAMRDFPILRISEVEHPRQGKKYRIWPLMNFAVAIDDLDLSVTHTLRGKDHADNAKKQEFIHAALKHPTPHAINVGRINFISDDEKIQVSCSATRPHIESGYFTGWDDPRIPFLLALKRRGYQPEALIKYALSVGISLNDKTVEMKEFFKTLNAFNKEILEPLSYRFFFVKNPVKIGIEHAPCLDLDLNLHPDNKKGGRIFSTNDAFYIQQEDVDHLSDGKLHRLMDCLNFKKHGKKYTFDSREYEAFKTKGDKIIHWLPADKKHLKDVEVLLENNTVITGFGEANLEKVSEGDIIQFERFGFVRLEKVEGNAYKFIFLHK